MPTDPPRDRSAAPDRLDRRGFALALAGGFAGAIALCWRALSSGGREAVGSTSGEVYAFLWGHGWMHQALWVERRSPIDIHWLDHPAGGVLWVKDPIGTVALSPLHGLLGVAGSYTLELLLLFALAAGAMFLLLRELGVGRAPALLIAPLFAFVPHTIGEAYNGNVETLHTAWQPLWLWAALRLARAPSAGRVGIAAAALWLLMLANQYWAICMAVATPPLLAAALWRARREPLARRRPGAAPWTGWPAAAIRAGAVAAAVALGALAFLPLALALWSTLTSDRQLTVIATGLPPMEPPYVVDLVNVVFPLRQTFPSPSPFQDIVYPGFLAAALALTAPLLAPRSPWRWLAPLLALLFFVFSLGPVLVVGGEVIGGRHDPVTLPWAWVIPRTPVLSSMTLSHRLAIPTAVFLSIGAGVALEGLWRRAGARRWARGALVALVAAALIETLAWPGYRLPLETTPVEKTACARLLRALPGDGAVLDLPLAVGHNPGQMYLWHQTQHRRPISKNLRHGIPPTVVARSALAQRALDFERALDGASAMAAIEAPGPLELEGLRAMGFGFVAVHQRPLAAMAHRAHADPDEATRAWLALLLAEAAPAMQLGGDTVLFTLDAGARDDAVERARALLDERDVRVLAGPQDADVRLTPWDRADAVAPEPDYPPAPRAPRGRGGPRRGTSGPDPDAPPDPPAR